MSIRRKLLLLIILAAAWPVAVSGFSSLAVARRALERASLSHQQERAIATAEIARRLVEESFQGLISSERYLDLSQLDLEAKTAAVRLIYRQFDRFNLVALFDEDGASVVPPAYDDNPAAIPELRGHEPVTTTDVRRFESNVPLAAALASGRAMGSVYQSAAGLPRVVLALRVASLRKEGQQRGALTVELSLTSLAQRLTLWGSESIHAFLVGGKGEVLISSDPSVAVGSVLPEIEGAASTDAPMARSLVMAGEPFVVGLAPIGSLQWAIVVRQPREIAFAAIASMRTQIIFWIAVSLVIAAVVALIFGSSLVQPIVALVNSARRLATGSFERLDVTARDEIGQLSRSFNEMAAAIAQRDQEIRAWNQELQARVEERTRELKEAQDQLIESRKLTAVIALGAGAAHEINNPLCAVQGMSELLLSTLPGESKARSMAQTIHDEARRISRIVAQLQALSATPSPGRTDRITCNSLIDEVLEDARRTLSDSQISIAREFTKPSPLIGGDRAALMRALAQLVDNARHAMPHGGTLTVGTSLISDAAVRITIRDTGHGIPADLLPRIFEPFFTNKSNWSGTGMGLALVRKTLEDHAAAIKVDSTVGKGTKVIMTFPLLNTATHLDC